ncbi:DinB family protein [Actinophytocola oryzae]|uniref:Uncharacterized protein DUF664 n=1 Tax=Actinophytocola oryzae TaxID=502181 RepID=A0A4R7VB97_9PSEU|nr:DinB family protein [Actinophytocola oryzae]TDV46302.1 uncharacterized protein DUF664 [Actinophytocola oryzae]
MTSTSTRPEAPKTGDLREQLTAYLDFLRSAVVLKATGLTDEQASRSLLPSELTTIAGLVSHLTYVEQYWFGVVVEKRPDPWTERFRADIDAEFTAARDVPIEQLVAEYAAECDRSRAATARHDLDDLVSTPKGAPVNLRWVLIHMIAETGRHAGHLDLLRELIDGSTGE